MPRKPKPFVFRGWYCTDAGGTRRKICPVDAGLAEAERLLATPAPAAGLTVSAALDAFLDHAETYYRKADGTVSREVNNFRDAFRELRSLAGSVPVADLDRGHIEAARAAMVAADLARPTINARVRRIKQAVCWLAENRLAPDAVAASVKLLKGLPAFRYGVREPEDVRPVDWADVEATLQELREPWRSMVLVQWYSGLRPGEVCGLWVDAVDETSAVIDFGRRHKTGWRGHKKRVPLGPRAWAVLAPWVEAARAKGRYHVFVATARGREVGAAPAVTSYDHAVARACERAGVDPWAPNRLRHAFATRVRAAFGLDAAQVALGHSGADVTQVYAERDEAAAARVAAELG